MWMLYVSYDLEVHFDLGALRKLTTFSELRV